MNRSHSFAVMWCSICAAVLPGSGVCASEPLVQRRESFDTDPGWQVYRNRLLPDSLPAVKQDFGFSPTQFAGGAKAGEIGGRVHRSTTPACYYRSISPLTLNDSFTASGRFSVRQAAGSSGVMLGWFHESSRGWRTPNSVALRIDGNDGKYWVFWEYGTQNGRTGGAGAFEGERYQTTTTRPYAADGTSHQWSLSWNPHAADEHGLLTLTIDDHAFPSVAFTDIDRQDGIQLNRFGIWNVQIAGSPLEFYIDDLTLNGVPVSSEENSGWEGHGNRVEFHDRIVRPLHDFGFRTSSTIDDTGGELGGVIFRDEKPCWYAAGVGRITLEDPLHASGTVVMHSSAADSGFCIGWFNSAAKREHILAEHQQASSDLLAVMIEGPSRIGHYFRATYRTTQREGVVDSQDVVGVGSLPVLRADKKTHTWQLNYNPAGSDGLGTIETVFDGDLRSISLRPGDRERGAVFDSFGVFNIQSGGHHVEFSIDDLNFTSRSLR
ncbi:MAG: hypothetical protein R3C17_13845 [Planctomycetaceae bacterium]